MDAIDKLMTHGEATRLADDIAATLRATIALRPNIRREGYAIRIYGIAGAGYYVGVTSGPHIHPFGSREAWEDQKDLLR